MTEYRFSKALLRDADPGLVQVGDGVIVLRWDAVSEERYYEDGAELEPAPSKVIAAGRYRVVDVDDLSVLTVRDG